MLADSLKIFVLWKQTDMVTGRRLYESTCWKHCQVSPLLPQRADAMCSPTASATAMKSSVLLRFSTFNPRRCSRLLNIAKDSHPSCLCLTHWQAREQHHYFQGITSVHPAGSCLPSGSQGCLGPEDWPKLWVTHTLLYLKKNTGMKCRLLLLHIALFHPIPCLSSSLF